MKVNDTVETTHGEKIKILEVREVGAKTKKGKVIQTGRKEYLAQSGDHKVWFPESRIKGAK